MDKFSLRIQRGDRIGILGKNGSGKSTFLKLLIDELEPDAGKVKRNKEIEFSYLDQTRSHLDLSASLWTTLIPTGGDYIDVMGKPRHVCGYLQDFLFDPAYARAPVSTLSGGQKNRLLLAKVLAHPKYLANAKDSFGRRVVTRLVLFRPGPALITSFAAVGASPQQSLLVEKNVGIFYMCKGRVAACFRDRFVTD